jgi:hypothetical protein
VSGSKKLSDTSSRLTFRRSMMELTRMIHYWFSVIDFDLVICYSFAIIYAINLPGFFFTICTIYMLIFDILLIVGLLVNQGHLLENEYVRKVTVMFFAVTTVFG